MLHQGAVLLLLSLQDRASLPSAEKILNWSFAAGHWRQGSTSIWQACTSAASSELPHEPPRRARKRPRQARNLRMNLRGELETSAASSEPPHEPQRRARKRPRLARNLNGKPRPPPAAQPPGRAATFATNRDQLTAQPPIPLHNQATRQLLMPPPHACKPHWHKISCCPRQRNRTQPNKTQLKVTFLSSRIFFFFILPPSSFSTFCK